MADEALVVHWRNSTQQGARMRKEVLSPSLRVSIFHATAAAAPEAAAAAGGRKRATMLLQYMTGRSSSRWAAVCSVQ
jgi:hypothetical protein